VAQLVAAPAVGIEIGCRPINATIKLTLRIRRA
jgi:hypothetical protein